MSRSETIGLMAAIIFTGLETRSGDQTFTATREETVRTFTSPRERESEAIAIASRMFNEIGAADLAVGPGGGR